MESLRNTKIRINDRDHSIAFQEYFFSRGGVWASGSNSVYTEDERFLYIDDSFSMTFGCCGASFNMNPHKEIFFDIDKKWDGTGVPQAGTVCEYSKRAKYKTSWVKVKVLFIGENLIVFEHGANGNEFSEQVADVSFRPIKTPEQVAAEERSAAIDAIDDMDDLIIGWGADKKMLAALYDAGYRKTEVKK